MKQLIIITSIIFTSLVLNGHETNIDSLLVELNKNEIDNKEEILNKLSQEYFNIDLQKSIDYAEQALIIADKKGNKTEKAISYSNLGIASRKNGEYNKALDNFEAALRIVKDLNNLELHSRIYNNIGIIYFNKGEYQEAINYYDNAIVQKIQIDDKKGIAIAYNNIGNVYLHTSEYQKAIQSYEKALNLFKEINFLRGIGSCYNNIAIIYEEWANNTKRNELNESALLYYEEARELFEQLNDSHQLANTLANIGNIYSIKTKYDSAIIYYKEALQIREEIDDVKGLIQIYINIGYTLIYKEDYDNAQVNLARALELKSEIDVSYESALILNKLGLVSIRLGKYKDAIDYCKRSNEIAIPLNFKDGIKSNYQQLSESYDSLKDISESYKYYKKFVAIKDSLFNTEMHEQLAELTTKYETEKKEQQIIIQNNKIEKNRLLIIIITISSFFLILISIAIIISIRIRQRSNIQKLENQLVIVTQQALASQMNPHFIFNTLNSIQYFILENNQRESNKYLTKFSNLMRLTLDNSQHIAISIKKELEALNLYLELEALRFEERFEYNINIDEELLDYKIPTLIIQPYIENAIWHGLLHKKEKGKIDIDLNLNDNYLICVVEDNGIGRKEAQKIKEKKNNTHKSLGTKITEKRLELINALHGHEMNVKYEDLFNGKGESAGTRVKIMISIT